jgi:hypothetical protein
MSTPPAAPPPRGYDYGGGSPVPPPTAELVVFLLVWVVIALITLLVDSVDPPQFVWASVALAVGFMLARGFAKLGRAHEGR